MSGLDLITVSRRDVTPYPSVEDMTPWSEISPVSESGVDGNAIERN